MRERTDVCGRFAPSPSGRMHLGNVFCAVLAWLSARSRGGRFLLRIEDLDVRRCKPEHARLLEEDLAWLGLDWDEGGRRGGPDGPYFQSECSELYAQALQMLKEHARVYPCFWFPGRSARRQRAAPFRRRRTVRRTVRAAFSRRGGRSAQAARARSAHCRAGKSPFLSQTDILDIFRRTSPGNAAISSCGARTVSMLTSWPWRWTTRAWA